MSATARRRQFTAEYKRKVLAEVEACTKPGEVGALLRREGLYSSHLTEWRRARENGALAGLAPRKRGPQAKTPHPLERKVVELERALSRAERRARRAEALVELQKNRLGRRPTCWTRSSGAVSGQRAREERPTAFWRCHPRKKTWSRACCGLGNGDASRRSRLGKCSDAHARLPALDLIQFCGVLPTVGGGFQHADTEAPIPA